MKILTVYAIGFNPVLTGRDFANWLPDEKSYRSAPIDWARNSRDSGLGLGST